MTICTRLSSSCHTRLPLSHPSGPVGGDSTTGSVNLAGAHIRQGKAQASSNRQRRGSPEANEKVHTHRQRLNPTPPPLPPAPPPPSLLLPLPISSTPSPQPFECILQVAILPPVPLRRRAPLRMHPHQILPRRRVALLQRRRPLVHRAHRRCELTARHLSRCNGDGRCGRDAGGDRSECWLEGGRGGGLDHRGWSRE